MPVSKSICVYCLFLLVDKLISDPLVTTYMYRVLLVIQCLLLLRIY